MKPEPSKPLKAGWRRVKFGDVVQLAKARSQDPLADGFDRYVGLEHLEPGDLRIRSWGNVADGVTFSSVFKPGQVLFGKRRAYQRKVAVADFAGVCSGDIYVLETKDAQVLLPELLPFICQTDAFFDHAVDTSAGSLSPRTNWTSLADFEFELPGPAEQTKLIAVLGALAEFLDSLREAITALAKLVKSARDEHFMSLNTALKRRLADSVESSAYGPRFSSIQYRESGTVKSLRTTDMPTFGTLDHSTAPFADLPPTTVAEHRIQLGDFLISRTGFTSGRAATFYLSTQDEGVAYIPAAFLIRLRLRPATLLSDYLVQYIQSSRGWSMIRSLQRGTQQLNISGTALMGQKVPMPDLKVQREFLDRVRELMQVQEACIQRERDTFELLKSVSTATLCEGA